MIQSFGIDKLVINRLGSPGGLMIQTPGDAPTYLVATALSATTIRIDWVDNSNSEEGFSIERSPNGTDTWVEVYTTLEGVITQQDDGRTENTEYWYRVRAFLGAEYSEYSNIAHARTHQEIFIPETSADIIVGDLTEDVGLIITYSATRGSLRQTGQIFIRSPFLDVVESDPLIIYNFDDVGITFSSESDINDIVLLVLTVDNSSIDNVKFYYLIEKITGTKSLVGLPDPDALYSSRSGVELVDQIRGRKLKVEAFPYAFFTSSGVLSAGYKNRVANIETTDWTFLWTVKMDAVSYWNMMKLNGGNNYIIYVNNGTIFSIDSFINGIRTGSILSLNTLDYWDGDLHLFGASYNSTTKIFTRIVDGIEYPVSCAGNEPLSSVDVAYAAIVGEYVITAQMYMKYSRALSSAELLDALIGNFVTDSIEYFFLFNNDVRNWATTEEDCLDAVSAQQINFGRASGTSSVLFSYKTDNSIFGPYALNKGFTQRGFLQIPYIPSGVKSVGDVVNDIECIPSGVIHNLADSYINGNPDNYPMDFSDDRYKLYAIWNKADRTIWKASIETANYGQHYRTDANGNYTLWHPSEELNQDFIDAHAETGHDGHIFVGLRSASGIVSGITEIAVFKNNLT